MKEAIVEQLMELYQGFFQCYHREEFVDEIEKLCDSIKSESLYVANQDDLEFPGLFLKFLANLPFEIREYIDFENLSQWPINTQDDLLETLRSRDILLTSKMRSFVCELLQVIHNYADSFELMIVYSGTDEHELCKNFNEYVWSYINLRVL